MTNQLKSELESIRDKYRLEIKLADELVSQFDGNSIYSELHEKCYEKLSKISADCSEDMRKFAAKIIEMSVSVLKQNAPCSFEAVAIGSIARGEATPYSDLEFFILIEQNTKQAICYYDMLAMTSYFFIGNLGETKLSYMAVKELHGWFDDRGKNGFKIDGLSDGAGNIPTGNTSKNENHFIVTPQQLAERYKTTLDNPDRENALRGDLTAMMAYTVSIYTPQDVPTSLLHEFKNLIKPLKTNQKRKEMNEQMLKTDKKKFNFVPRADLIAKGFNADVKKELYRFPSIILLDISIVSECLGSSSWHSLEMLGSYPRISADLAKSMRFLLAAATYIRLAAYLHHDSHDDRISLTKRIACGAQESRKTVNRSTQRWFLPCDFFSSICVLMTPLKNSLQTKDLMSYQNISDPWGVNVTTLFYSGKPDDALLALKQQYMGLCESPVETALLMTSVLQHDPPYTMDVIADILCQCGEIRAALKLWQYMTDTNIRDRRVKIVDCHRALGDYDKAIDALENIMSPRVYFPLGRAYMKSLKFDEAEASFVMALQIECSIALAVTLTDYYGDPVFGHIVKYDKVGLLGATSPIQRLSMITDISPRTTNCITALGDLYHLRKQYTLANAYYDKSLQFLYDLHGRHAAAPVAARALAYQGINYSQMKCYSKTELCYSEALAIYRAISHVVM